MNYIEMIKRVDEVFPQTADFDYRTLSTDEMSERIQKLLKDLDVYRRLSEGELKRLDVVLTQWYGPVFTNKSFVLGRRGNGENYLDYDQFNQYLKRNVLYVKNYVMKLITKYIKNPYNSYSVEQTGSIEEIEEHIKPENITEYITKLFTISKENGTLYDNDMLLSEIIADIKYRYGINEEMEEKGSSLIRKKFDGAVRESSIYSGDVTILDGMAFHSSVSQDSEQFKAVIGKSIKDIIEYIEAVTSKRLAELKEYEKRRAEWQAQRSIKESSEDEDNMGKGQEDVQKVSKEELIDEFEEKLRREHVDEDPYEIKNIREKLTDEEVDAIVDRMLGEDRDENTKLVENREDIPLYSNFAETIGKYAQIEELIKKQKEIMQKISALEAEKKKLEAEFKKNDEAIKGGFNVL